MAAFGLEAAKYLAENYLDESHAADFLSAMETVAKYGLNGSVSDGGKGRSFRHEKEQRLCRLEGKSGKDKAAGHIPECEIQRLPVIFLSLQNQSSLSNSWISANISRFMKWLAV